MRPTRPRRMCLSHGHRCRTSRRLIGGVSGAVALDLIVNADTAQQSDEGVMGLPVWPMMETTITPLTFGVRRGAVLAIRE